MIELYYSLNEEAKKLRQSFRRLPSVRLKGWKKRDELRREVTKAILKYEKYERREYFKEVIR